MAPRTPLHLAGLGAGAGADDVRRWMGALTGNTSSVANTGDLLVSEADPTPNMSVDVAAGQGMIVGDSAVDQGSYFVDNDGPVNLAIAAADPSDPRIDLVVAHVRDSAYVPLEPDEFQLRVITGTPASSPVAPDTPDDAMKLAEIDVAASATSIEDDDITDTRVIRQFGGQSTWAWRGSDDAGADAVAQGVTSIIPFNLGYASDPAALATANAVRLTRTGLWRLSSRIVVNSVDASAEIVQAFIAEVGGASTSVAPAFEIDTSNHPNGENWPTAWLGMPPIYRVLDAGTELNSRVLSPDDDITIVPAGSFLMAELIGEL